MGQEESNEGVGFVMLLLILTTIALAAPPALQGQIAAERCASLPGDAAGSEAKWITLPVPHWVCVSGAETVHELGWWL